jgi:proteasome beta subunit
MEAEIKNNIVKTGTTILGIVCKEGLIMAGDRRANIGGSIIISKNTLKVLTLNDYLLLSGCGSATEVQKVASILPAELKLKELKSKKRPTVKDAASLLSNIHVYQSAFIIAGYDEDGTFSMYEILGGLFDKVDDYTASVGSGMPYVLGLLERQYKKGLTLKEGVELAKEALKSSTQRDMGSGNGIDIFTITKEGIKKVVEQTIEPEYRDDKRD